MKTVRPKLTVTICKEFRVLPRSLTANMIRPLCMVYKAHPHIDGTWLKVDDVLVELGLHDESRDWTRLKHWGFIEPKPGLRHDGSKNSGVWRLTELAERFVAREESFFAVAYVLQDKRVAFSDGNRHHNYPFTGQYLPLEVTTVRKAAGEKFNFDKMMGR